MKWLRGCFCVHSEVDDIKELDFTHSSLNDVPSDVFVYERTLEDLHLDANQIQDLPRPLFHCHELRRLGLSDNEVQNLPPAIASLINLQHLDISKNSISDIPDNIKGCKQLSVVDASVNPLGKLPEGFTQLVSLTELYLSDTFLEYLPANFGRLSRLRILELRENRLATLPRSIARLTSLERLDIGQNEFSDLPEVVSTLVNLTELWCDSNKIKEIPEHIGSLKKLSCLDVSKNRIEYISPDIQHCKELVDVTLTENGIQSLPDTIGELRKLTTLKVDDNALNNLPETLGNMSGLEELVLNQNELERLPASIGLLRKLHTLYIDDNLLEELPPEIGSCTSLTILSARSNQLYQIPGEIGHISKLRVVNIADNHLTNLPVSMTNLELGALWLSDNQNKPLVPLQSDIDTDTGQRVLTCFMLPQQERTETEDFGSDTDSWHPSIWDEERDAHMRIKFASDEINERPGKLMRAPTPYPKELKVMAKHARNLRLSSSGTKINGEVVKEKTSKPSPPVSDGMVTANSAELPIKEAKVTKPQSPVTQEKHVSAAVEKKTTLPIPAVDSQSPITSSQSMSQSVKLETALPVVSKKVEKPNTNTKETSPVERLSHLTEPMKTAEPSVKPSPNSSEPVTPARKPPPYDIAALYSKKAPYFNTEQQESISPLPSPALHVSDDRDSGVVESSESEYSTATSIQTVKAVSPPHTPVEQESESKPNLEQTSNLLTARKLEQFDIGSPIATSSPMDSGKLRDRYQDDAEDSLNSARVLREVSRTLLHATSPLSSKPGSLSSNRPHSLATQATNPDPFGRGIGLGARPASVAHPDPRSTEPVVTPESPTVYPGQLSALHSESSTSSVPSQYKLNSTFVVKNEPESSAVNDTYTVTPTKERSLERTIQSNGILSTIEQVAQFDSNSSDEQTEAAVAHAVPLRTLTDTLFTATTAANAYTSVSRIPKFTAKGSTVKVQEVSRPANFTQDKPAGNVVAPTPHRPQPPPLDSPPPTPPPRTTGSQLAPQLGPKPLTSPTYTTGGISTEGLLTNGQAEILKPPSSPSSTSDHSSDKSASPQPSFDEAKPKTSISHQASGTHIPQFQKPAPVTRQLSGSFIPKPQGSTSSTDKTKLPGPTRQLSSSSIPQPAIRQLSSSSIPKPQSLSSNPPSTTDSKEEHETQNSKHTAPVNGLPEPKTMFSVTSSSRLPQLSTSRPGSLARRENEPGLLPPADTSRTSRISSTNLQQQTGGTRVHSGIPAPTSRTSTSRLPQPNIGSSLQKHRVNPVNGDKQSSAWMFGTHTNPKVFPVAIERNPGLGFSISGGVGSQIVPGKLSEEGIFVTKVHPNGPAKSLLCPGDKILQVNGTDVTNMEHEEAVDILKNTGRTVNLMISRG